MSIFKNLKGLFIEDDGKAKNEESNEATATPVASEEVVTTASDNEIDDVPASTPKTGKPDAKFVDILLKAVEKNNMEGFDYLEYKSSLQSLANMDMDEQTKYKSSLAMAQTMGATPEKLIASADHYLNVLMQENGKFKEALKSQREKQVTGREGDLKQTIEAIEKRKQQIIELEKAIKADEAKLDKLKAGISKAAAKVQATGDSFNHAFNVVTGQIQADVQKMKQYLK